MKTDIVKWALNGFPSAAFNVVKDENDLCCWFNKKVGIVREYRDCGPIELSLSNSRLSFFDECVTQRFFSVDPCKNSTTVHIDPIDNTPIPDAYSKPNSYQSHCMDLSRKLMTFAVGCPRFFENNAFTRKFFTLDQQEFGEEHSSRGHFQRLQVRIWLSVVQVFI